jgi:glycosyltransferase involved in cell wall biosynthesis
MPSITNKIKVAWICHFSNQQIREQLSLSKMRVFNFLKSVSGKQKSHYGDFSPWVNNLIKEFEEFEDVELHIIAPHKGLIPLTCEFQTNGIFYHFFRPDNPLLLSKIGDKIYRNRKKKFRIIRHCVRRFIKQIQPDIVNLIGTENPHYSITVLDIKDIPIYITAQTVYTNPLRKIYSDICNDLSWDIELKIHQKEKYFGCDSRMHRDLILKNKPDAIVFKTFFPIQKPERVKQVLKEYDFVFFAAGVTAKKGIEDAIEALAIAKKKKEDITLNVVGRCAANYKVSLLKKIEELNLTDNILFNDYFPLHADMHQHVKQARFALLPVKLDAIPSTILEAALLELPVVTYKTTGTPYLNKNGEAILICDIGDIQGLSSNMIKLMENPTLAEKLKKNAKRFVETEFDNTKNARRLVENYKAVLEHYHYNKPISQELLFSTKEFPIY